MEIEISHRRILGILLSIFVFYTQYVQYVYKAIPFMVSILGGAVLAFAYFGMLINENYWNPFEVKEFKLLALFFGVTFFTGVLSASNIRVHLIYWLSSFEYFLLVPCFMYLIRTKEDLFFFCTLYLILSLLCAISLLINPVVSDTGADGLVRYSLSRSLNVNMLGLFFSLGCFCCCVLMSFFRKFEKFGWFIIAFLFYANNLTASRKNLIAIAIIVGLWFILCWFQNHRNNVIYIFFVTILIAILVYYCYKNIYLGSGMANRMSELFISSDGKQNARIDMYNIALGIFKKHPIFGLGFHGYGYFVGKVGSYSHATYAEVIADFGLCGSILFLGMYVYSFIKVLINIKRINQIEELKDSLMILKLCLVLWCVTIFMSSVIIYFYELVCFIIWGVLFSMIQITNKKICSYFRELEYK